MATISTDIRLHFLFELPHTSGLEDPAGPNATALESGLNVTPHASNDPVFTASKSNIELHPAPEQPSFALDASIPSDISLLSLLPDLLALAYEARPRLQSCDIRWQAVTATGVVLDIAQPVANLGLSHGSTVFIRPYRSVPAPVIKDAAEALAQVAAKSQPPNPNLPYTCALGIWGLLAVGIVVPWDIPGVVWAGIIAGLSALGFILTGFRTLLASSTVLLGGGVFAEVIGAHSPAPLLPANQRPIILTGLSTFTRNLQGSDPDTFAKALSISFAAALAIAALSVGLRMWRTQQVANYVRTASFLAVFLLGTLVMTLAFPLGIRLHHSVRECFIAMGLLGVLWAMVLIVISPFLATKLGGVPIIRLPSAGQDLEVSDAVASSEEIQASAYKATAILEGTLCGAAWVLISSFSIWMFATPLQSSGIAIMCLLAIGTLLLHAHRHHRSLAVRSLWFAMLLAVLALIFAAQGHLVMIICGTLAALCCALAPWWVRLLRDMAPTTMVWFERLECVCLAVILPLGCYLLDIFSLIRGISL